jgi:hypothetical protein
MLTIQYFTNVLSDFRAHTILNHPDSHKLHFVQLLETRNTFLKPTTLYIAPHTPEILDLLGTHPPVNMILIYSDTISLEDISVFSSYAHNLILIENKSMTTISNACLQTLSEYQDVQRTLIEIHQMVRSNKSMQDILDYAFQIFNNPIFVRDKYFRILGHTKIEEKQKYIQKDISGIKHVLVLTHPKNIFTDVSHNYIKGFFNDVFDTISCILFKEKIVAVVQSKKRLDEGAMQNLKSFLSDSGLISGISQPFSSFTDIKKCYNQAQAANRACNKQENRSLSFYSESALYHMLDICDQHTNLRDLCHPALFKRINYDTTYDTQYVPLLHAYVLSMKNKNALIKSMHLHRNTLYYRIKKIEEILECSLDDASTFFNLHLSFSILEYMGAGHFSDH